MLLTLTLLLMLNAKFRKLTKQCVFLYIAIVVIVIVVFIYHSHRHHKSGRKHAHSSFDHGHSGNRKNRSAKSREDNNVTCKLPVLKTDDPELALFFRPPTPIACAHEHDWVSAGNGTFEILPDVNKTNVFCDYTHFWRQKDNEVDKAVIRNYTSGANLLSDFFTVQCNATDTASGSRKLAHSNIYAGIKPSDEAIRRARNIPKPPGSLHGMSVYMLGFDSLSRMTFMRKLKNLYEHLTENLQSVVLEGYNIVGDGTPQALIPILTGKTELELPATRKIDANGSFVNVYPFVWNNFRDAGYVTQYGEDTAGIGTFTYRLRGFDKQPTDHYMRTFWLMYEILTWERKLSDKWACIGSRPHHVVFFQYVEKFFDAYPNIPKFAFQFHSLLSHNNINEVQSADLDMVDHLRMLEASGHLENTMLIVFADHGHRFGEIRRTQQGKLEERLPFFSIVMPKWFREKYPEAMANLRRNAKRLTTPFDIHPTLLSVLDFQYPPLKDQMGRSISLFNEVPNDRTCADAHIEPHWCTCLQWEELRASHWLANIISGLLVRSINAETSKERKFCAPLKLEKIIKFLRYLPDPKLLSFRGSKDIDGRSPDFGDDAKVSKEFYQIDFVTMPGGAHYEASVAHWPATNKTDIDLNSLSHINAYGDLPHCIIDRNYFLAKHCVCYDKMN